MENTQPRGKFATVTAVVLASLLVIVFAIPLLGLVKSGDASASLQNPSSTESATPTPTPTPTPTSDTCPTEFVQNPADRGELSRMVAGGFAELTGKENSSPEEKRDAVIALSGRDALFLADSLELAGLWDNSNNVTPLLTEDKTCLSKEGQEKFFELKGSLTASGVKLENVEVSPDAFNSGVVDGQVVASDQAGITGDRAGWRVTLPDGTVFERLDRCLNGVHYGKPNLPPGKTDNPPPVTPDCPPGQIRNVNGVCVESKSNKPGDYRQPGDGGAGQDVGEGPKPVVPPVTTAPEAAPPPVQTTQPGGNGVVDTPTNPPGSETGVQAPAATPAPAAPATPSPNEGGSSDGEVGGF